ncbi:hypothetical protein NW739_00485 [Mycoplasmopsis felis]|uniref:hypothetical protein n=1 Tax=Mycoplasmopsis felis TaxID=33923 RepID=UPI0021DF7EBC|nr:hypothetical protein [Mycoplasmopsis felis]MCU9939321.1 hypothetical protein [Mycoplasmopsis felis]
MKGYKRKIIIWTFVGLLALIAIIALSFLISSLEEVINIYEKVTLDTKIIDSYQFTKAYSIGGLAFSRVVFVMSFIIAYAGFRSLKYSEMFS